MSLFPKKSFLAAAALIAMTFNAEAAQRFNEQTFRAAQAAGRTIVVDVTASWCSTCRQQKPAIQAIENERPSLVVYEVDFDSAKAVVKRFRVQWQSTLIVFKGEAEVGRSTGETDPLRIRALIAKGL